MDNFVQGEQVYVIKVSKDLSSFVFFIRDSNGVDAMRQAIREMASKGYPMSDRDWTYKFMDLNEIEDSPELSGKTGIYEM